MDRQYKKHKQNLAERAHPSNYLRCLGKSNYQVYRRDTKKIKNVRTCEFVLALAKEENATESSSIPKTEALHTTSAEDRTPNPKGSRQKISALIPAIHRQSNVDHGYPRTPLPQTARGPRPQPRMLLPGTIHPAPMSPGSAGKYIHTNKNNPQMGTGKGAWLLRPHRRKHRKRDANEMMPQYCHRMHCKASENNTNDL